MDNDWNGLADLIANLITKYAGVLDLDNLPNPTPVKNIEDKKKFDMAKTVKVKLLRKINSKKLNYDEKSKKVFSSAKIKQQILRICQEKKWNDS